MGKTTIKATNTNYVIAEEKKTVLASNPILIAHYRKWADGTLDMDLIYSGQVSSSTASGVTGLATLLILNLNVSTYFEGVGFVGSTVCNHSWTTGSGIGAPVGTIQNGNNFTLYCASNSALSNPCTVLVKMTGWWK